MTHLQNDKKMILLLGLTICIITTNSNIQALKKSVLPQSNTAKFVIGALVLWIPSHILLKTKGTPQELKWKTKLNDPWIKWARDWIELLKIWNLFLKHKTYKKLFNKRWIGSELNLVDEKTTKISADGKEEIAFTDKKIKCLPTGFCGNLDAYVLKQCESLFRFCGHIGTATLLIYALYGNKEIKEISNLW